MRTKLIGSENTLEKIITAIQKYFFWDNAPILKYVESLKVYYLFYPETSPRAGKQLINYLVREKRKRFRFERLIKEGE